MIYLLTSSLGYICQVGRSFTYDMMEDTTEDLLKAVQAQGVPVVVLERLDILNSRKRKFSSVEPDDDSDILSKCYRINVISPLSDSKSYKQRDDDVDSGIDGCSSVQSSVNGATASHSDGALSHEDDVVSDNNSSVTSRKHRKKPLENGEYAVQKVIQHKYSDDGRHLFLIKWIGWGSHRNTWEPIKHLHCPDLLTDFFKQKILEGFHMPPGKHSVPLCPPYNDRAYREIIRTWTEAVQPSKILYSMRHNPSGKPKGIQKLVDMLESALQAGCGLKSQAFIKDVKDNCVLWKRLYLRRAQKAKLQAWEHDINRIGPGGITVENNVDLEELPANFKFINQCVMGKGVEPPQPALVGCECDTCGAFQKRCCPGLANADFPYNKHQSFRLDRGYAVYECNSLCKCGPDCVNRVVQKGRKVRLCIFRTNNGRGWGVKASQFIKKGTFISTYIGEVLTVDEAEARSEEYEREGLAYLFDLDYTFDDDCTYSVDATYMGNESHFINHSCDPNSYVVGVYYENLDPKMPLLALFAARNIARGEEITFNYNGNSENTDVGPASPTKTKIHVPCKCGARDCTKYLFKTRMSNISTDEPAVAS